jgi:molybdopterin-guanine dinucleotide biosynthesis protein A
VKYSISGIILAGGGNRRFNSITKANIVIDGKRIISRIIDTIRDIFDEIIIVTNTPGEFKEFKNYKIVSDQFLNVGPLGGIHAALKASSNDAIFVFAGDMPLLDKRLINRQIDFYFSNKCDVLIPSIGELIEPLHSIYSISVLKSLEEYLSGDHDYAVREFIKILDARYLQFEGSEENKNAFTNINSASDLKHLKITLFTPPRV